VTWRSFDKLSIVSAVDDTIGATPLAVGSGSSTFDTTPTLQGTLVAPLVGNEEVAIWWGNAYRGKATVSGTTWSWTPPSGLSVGTYVIEALVTQGSLGPATQTSAAFTLSVNSNPYTFDNLTSLTSRSASGFAYTSATKDISISGSLVNANTADTDTEYRIYSGSNNGSYINFDDTKLAAGTKMISFSASFQLFLSTSLGDGVAFSFGNPTSLSAVTGTSSSHTSNYDWGYGTGLSVEFRHDGNPVVRWNGAILTNTAGSTFAGDTVAKDTQISVSTAGVITVTSAGSNIVTASIPGWSSMTAAGTAGWAFGLSGRNGGFTGTAWVDDLSISGSRVLGPVVIDLNHDGAISYQQISMDVDGDGRLDKTAWAGAQDAVLVWDKYADGHVHDNSQFAFAQYGGVSDLTGLAAKFDTNQDGLLSEQDAQFAEFKVWQDENQNGVSDAGEVRSLADWGITSINLVSDGVQRTPVEGVTEAGQTTAETADGRHMLVADAAFNFSALEYSVDGDKLYLLGAEMHLDLSSLVAAHPVTAVDLTGTGANTLKLSMADVLRNTSTDGVRTLALTGDANDRVVLDQTEWSRTGSMVDEAGHTYVVYNGSSDASVQLLIDQQMLTTHLTN
jgi:hypothetical protein